MKYLRPDTPRLKFVLHSCEIPAVEVARRVGISKALLSSIARGYTKPTAHVSESLATFFEMPEEVLFAPLTARELKALLQGDAA